VKVEVLHTGEGVEIHLENEDGSKTVWLCDNEQAAIFKLANLLFSAQEDPKQIKRSLLIGDFDRAEEAKSEDRKKPLADRAADVAARLEKEGLVKKGSVKKGIEGNEELYKLLEQMKKQGPAPYTEEFLKPAVHVYPAVYQPVPLVMPMVGDFPFDGTGIKPFMDGYGTVTDVNVSGINGASAKPMNFSNVVLEDVSLGCTISGNQKVHHFKTSFGMNG
jgi:hypothetical protein